MYLFPHFSYPGGAGKFVLTTAQGLAQRGRDVAIVTLRANEGVEPPSGVEWVVLGGDRPDSLRHWASLGELLGRLRRTLAHAGDHVLFPQVFPSSYWGLLAAGPRGRRPCVWYCHEPNPVLYEPRALPDVPWHLRLMVSGAWPTLLLADRALVGRADRIVVNSSFTARRVARAYGRRAEIVPPGVDVPPEPPAGAREPLVVSFGKLLRFKRLDFALRAFARLSPNLRRQTRFLIVGEGPDGPRLRRLATFLGVGPSVSFLPFLDGPALRSLLARARVHLAPAVGEPFGMTVAESLAMGTPVVATRAGGYPDIVDHGASGLLVPPHDVDGFAAALGTVLEDDGLWARMSREGRARVRERFSWGTTVAALDRVLEGVVAP